MQGESIKRLFRLAMDYVAREYPNDLPWSRSITPEYFDLIGPKEFLIEYCWVVYTAGFKAKILEQKFRQIRQAFRDFDIDELYGMESVEPVLTVFRHRGKAEGFLRGAKLIYEEGFESFKQRVKRQGMTALRQLPYVGEKTQKHLARNIGLVDVAKDDVWLERLAERVGASSVETMTSLLAREFKESLFTVDLVLWRFCSTGGWRVVGADSLGDCIEILKQ